MTCLFVRAVRRRALLLTLLTLASGLPVLDGSAAGEGALVTPTVELIRRVKPAIVPLFSSGTNDELNSGAGAVIHPAGFILTADHVCRDRAGVAIFGMKREPYQIVGRLPEKDLAVLKVESPTPRAFLPLGHSAGVCEGETVIAIGNPGGRGIVYSQGIVSCASMDPSWPNVLSQTFWRDTENDSLGRDDFLQFDAASNRGNSGGPLINAAGELIGVVASKALSEEAINWAIPVDRARRLFDYLVQPEEADGFWAGVEVDLLDRSARVTAVAKGSPASQAGLEAGDIIVALDGMPVSTGPGWLLCLAGHKPGSQLTVQFKRRGKASQALLTLAPYPLATACSEAGRAPGLRFALYRPGGDRSLKRMPDFTALKPVQEGTITKLGPDEFVKDPKENYAVVFNGYIQFPEAGRYRLILTSDDGSRCFLNQRLIIDNDFRHPEQSLSRLVRVPAGLVPIRVEYFENRGGRALRLQVKFMDKQGQSVQDAVFYRDR